MTDTDHNTVIITKTDLDIPEKQLALGLLVDNGLSVPQAAKQLGYNTDYAYHINSKLSRYKIGNDKKLVKSAHATIQNCVNGTPFGSVDKIKDSTALQAASMVMDRFDPAIKQSQNINVNVSISPVDLSEFKRK
jgi:hypothetical protein